MITYCQDGALPAEKLLAVGAPLMPSLTLWHGLALHRNPGQNLQISDILQQHNDKDQRQSSCSLRYTKYVDIKST